ncbi:NYN domain-containing protein [Schizophyllum amplum]|uniref:NYN domain-containing protein n=1 Tax=Schizophyllum amplum TaxID=97359 RepID=A0A550CAD1_9AGAR|nr:NYN domain-containing protein [Auriculariopsis ampla]
MSSQENGVVGIFWDYENVPVPPEMTGYDAVKKIRDIALQYGSINVFKAYLEMPHGKDYKFYELRSQLQISGVSLTDTPHNGWKEVADLMLLVDMMCYAWDNPLPCTIIVVSGDRDFAYAMAALRLRNYRIILISPAENNPHVSLHSQASRVYDWRTEVLGLKSAPMKNPSKPYSRSSGHNKDWSVVPVKAAPVFNSTAASRPRIEPTSVVARYAHTNTAKVPAALVNDRPLDKAGQSSSTAMTITTAATSTLNAQASVANGQGLAASQAKAQYLQTHQALGPLGTSSQLPSTSGSQTTQQAAQRNLPLAQILNEQFERTLSAITGKSFSGPAQQGPQPSRPSQPVQKTDIVPDVSSASTSQTRTALVPIPEPIFVPSRSPSVILLDDDQRERIAIPLRHVSKSPAPVPLHVSFAPLSSLPSTALQSLTEEDEEAPEPPRSPTPPPMDGVESSAGEEDMDIDSSPPPTPKQAGRDKILTTQGTTDCDQPASGQPSITSVVQGGRSATEQTAHDKAVEVARRLTAQAKEVGAMQCLTSYSRDAYMQASKAQENTTTASKNEKVIEDVDMFNLEDTKAEREQAIVREREAAARVRGAAAAHILKQASMSTPTAPSKLTAGTSRPPKRPSLEERLSSPKDRKISNVLPETSDRHWRPASRHRRDTTRSPSPMLVDGRVEYRRPALDGEWLSTSFGDDFIYITGDGTYWERASRGEWESRARRSRSRSASPARRGCGLGPRSPPRNAAHSLRPDAPRRCSDPMKGRRMRTPEPRGRSRGRTPSASIRARSSSPMGSPVHRPPQSRPASTLQAPPLPKTTRGKTPVPANLVPPQVARPASAQAMRPASRAASKAPAQIAKLPAKPAPQFVKATMSNVSASLPAKPAAAPGQLAPVGLPQTVADAQPTAASVQPTAASAQPPIAASTSTKWKPVVNANEIEDEKMKIGASSSFDIGPPEQATSIADGLSASKASGQTMLEGSELTVLNGPRERAPSASARPVSTSSWVTAMAAGEATVPAAGVRNFKQYIEAAAAHGIVYEGTYNKVEWVALEDEWTEGALD